MKLKDGEFICPVCKGKGIIIKHDNSFKYVMETAISCYRCRGTRKVDWIGNIVGNHPVKIISETLKL